MGCARRPPYPLLGGFTSGAGLLAAHFLGELLAVIDAQRTLASAEQTLAQLESAISDDQVPVFLALGGGSGVAENHAEGASRRKPGRW